MKKLAIAFFSFFVAASSWSKSSGNVIVPDGSRFSTPEAAARYEMRHLKSSPVTKYEFVDCPKLQKGNATVAGIVAKGTYHCRMLVTIESGGNKTVTHSPIYVYWLGDDGEGESENKCTAIAGKVTKLSVPAGWAHLDSTGEVRDFKPSGPAPDQVCKGGCQYLLMSNEVVPGSTVYAPKINNGGYHPVFTQYTYAGTDTQCEADTDLTTPSTPPPPPEKPKEPEKPFTCPTGKCPGVANGQQVCVPCGSTPGQGEGDGDDKGKDKEPGDSSGNNNGSDKGDKDGSKDGSSDGTPGANGNGSGNGTGPGTGNGNGTGTGSGSGSGSGDGKGDGKGKGDKEEGEDGAVPSFGERPGLYEPKYKNGVKGVWDEKSASIKNTQLGQLSKRLVPTVNNGSCPSWTFDLNFGRGLGFGSHKLQPPCTIWPMLRAIVIVCALILARKLVFGG